MTTRLRLCEMMSLRLADEGVPVRAIARVTLQTFAVTQVFLTAAVHRGDIRAMPADDWPKGTRFREPTVPSINLNAVEPWIVRLMAFHGMPRAQATFMALLIEYGTANDATLLGAVCGEGAGRETVKVHACILRRYLGEAHGIQLKTVWGVGYALSDKDRAWLRRHYGLMENSVAA